MANAKRRLIGLRRYKISEGENNGGRQLETKLESGHSFEQEKSMPFTFLGKHFSLV